MKYARWFISAMRPYRWILLLTVVLSLLLTGLSMLYVYVCKSVVDIATGGGAGTLNALGLNDARSGLIAFGAAMVAVIVLRDAARHTKSYLQTLSTVRLRNSLRQKQFDSLLHISGDLRGKFHSGDILNRIQDDTATTASAACSTIPEIVGTGCQFGAAFIYLLCIDARLAWVLVIALPAGVLGFKFVTRSMRRLSIDVREKDSLVQSHVQESVQHQTLIKTLEYDQESSAMLSSLHEELYGKTMKRMRFTIWARMLMGLTMSGGYAIAFLWGVSGIYRGTVTFGLMTAYLQLVGQLQRPLLQLSECLPGIFHSTASIDRLEEMAQLPQENSAEPVMMDGVAGIRVSGLRFRYRGSDADVYRDFSHDFRPGGRTAVVGPTGAGKSTLVKLFLALETPAEGRISVYGRDGSEVEISPATRCNMVYVPQGNSLFSGTIRENLLMGRPDATEEDLVRSLRLAAADFVLELPEGLDTQCLEAGGRISEGQAQRIAIARALLRPGSIMLMDEFSSALDDSTEALLLERITAAENGKTMIFITHRQSVTHFCDDILEIH